MKKLLCDSAKTIKKQLVNGKIKVAKKEHKRLERLKDVYARVPLYIIQEQEFNLLCDDDSLKGLTIEQLAKKLEKLYFQDKNSRECIACLYTLALRIVKSKLHFLVSGHSVSMNDKVVDTVVGLLITEDGQEEKEFNVLKVIDFSSDYLTKIYYSCCFADGTHQEKEDLVQTMAEELIRILVKKGSLSKPIMQETLANKVHKGNKKAQVKVVVEQPIEHCFKYLENVIKDNKSSILVNYNMLGVAEDICSYVVKSELEEDVKIDRVRTLNEVEKVLISSTFSVDEMEHIDALKKRVKFTSLQWHILELRAKAFSVRNSKNGFDIKKYSKVQVINIINAERRTRAEKQGKVFKKFTAKEYYAELEKMQEKCVKCGITKELGLRIDKQGKTTQEEQRQGVKVYKNGVLFGMYDSLGQCAKALNINKSTVSRRLKAFDEHHRPIPNEQGFTFVLA